MKVNGDVTADTTRMRIINYIIIDSDYTMNIKWMNYLCHLVYLLLLCGYTSSTSSLVVGSSNTNSTSHNLLLHQSTIFKHNTSTSLTSISSDKVSTFMLSNFTFDKRHDGLALNTSNENMENLVSDVIGSITYQISNFNIDDKSNNHKGHEKTSFSDVKAYECGTRMRAKRAGPKRARYENLLKNMTVNSTRSDITTTGTNLNRYDAGIPSDMTLNLFNRVSRAPQNAKRKKLKNVNAYTADVNVTKPIKVSLLGLFELTSRSGLRMEGRSELAAAELAVRHINERGLLEGYVLDLMTNDTQCDAGVGVDRFFHAIYTQNKTKMVMLLGSACSEVTESLAKVVPYWSMIMVSFGSTAPALSDREEFPFFFRTVMPDSAHNPARIAFIRHFKWDTVATFSQNEEVHSLAVNDLVTQLERANISCSSTLSFSDVDYKDQLQMLRDLDTRIIIGSFSDEMAAKIFCEAHRLGMYGADYVWILQESENKSWWSTEEHNDCPLKHLHAAIENVIIVSSFNHIVGDEQSISGLTNALFEKELSKMNVTKPFSRYVHTTYDAVWSIALALKSAEQLWRNETRMGVMKKKLKGLNSFDYNRSDLAEDFVKQFGLLKFKGISVMRFCFMELFGPVSFDGNDRIGITVFQQIQFAKLQPVALYHPETEFLDFKCPSCATIKWESNVVPIAKRIFKLRFATVSKFAFFTVTSFAIFGIILSIMFLAFNLHFRKLKSIKLSSYRLSNITAVGCVFVYGAVILLGLDHSTLPSSDTAFPTVCTARVYLLSAGFSLTFGSMFAKTYRVHRIFTHSWGGIFCKDKMLKDTKLISMVCCLLLVDALVVTFWTLLDPMERHLRNLTIEISHTDRSVVYQPQVEVCQSLHTKTWLGFLYAYKGLLLAVGVYMAWETRHVKIPALNDSKYIGFSVYGAVITSVSVVVLANLLSEQVTLAFIIITSIILTSTTATLCLVFLPKMNDIFNKEIQVDPVIHSMGLKLEYNTRRFATDDKRELQYRVEVQNRVYRKEMATLDAEIAKLEKMLENRSSSTSSSQVSMIPHIKPEIVIDESSADVSTGKTPRPSISGTLPMLLLSVLPPVIPRASWPNTEHMQIPMRRSVCFSSQPQMRNDDANGIQMPAIDLLNLRLTQQQSANERIGILNRIKNLFVGGSRAPSRKTSTASLAPSHIANALKSHMSVLTGLLPSTSSSCHVLNTTTNLPEHETLRRQSYAHSGNAIHSTNIEISEPELIKSRNRRKSMAFTISAHIEKVPTIDIDETPEEAEVCEPRVNFILPVKRRSSIIHQNSQPTLRERVKGSPRFPHRIVPTSSLNALEDSFKSKMCSNSNEQISPAKWKSMEEESLHMTSGNKTLAVHLQNLDKISIINDSNKNIECIDEEIIQSPILNKSNDIYDVM